MGQARLPGGERRKASQRRVGHASLATVWVTPDWPPGARVAWQGRVGMFLRDADDDQVELMIGSRTYRVRRAEVRSA
jgi:hypothetical protein